MEALVKFNLYRRDSYVSVENKTLIDVTGGLLRQFKFFL